MAVFFKAYAQKVEHKELEITETLEAYTDRGDVSGWAIEGVKFAVQNKLISGYGSADKIAPKAVATRAQVAVILKKFVEKVIG